MVRSSSWPGVCARRSKLSYREFRMTAWSSTCDRFSPDTIQHWSRPWNRSASSFCHLASRAALALEKVEGSHSELRALLHHPGGPARLWRRYGELETHHRLIGGRNGPEHEQCTSPLDAADYTPARLTPAIREPQTLPATQPSGTMVERKRIDASIAARQCCS